MWISVGGFLDGEFLLAYNALCVFCYVCLCVMLKPSRSRPGNKAVGRDARP